jgi:hypothetical protein
VFWCAEKGNFALLVLFKKVPTLVLNGNVKLLTAYSARGQLMYHEELSMFQTCIGSTWAFDAPALKFCKRNFRTPAWVNNVISLHES